MIVEQVIIGFFVGIAIAEIYYGWKLNQERKILETLKRAWFTSHMYTFDEEDKEEEQMDAGKRERRENVLKDAVEVLAHVNWVRYYQEEMFKEIEEKKDVGRSILALHRLQKKVDCLKEEVDYLVEKYDKEIQELLKGLE